MCVGCDCTADKSEMYFCMYIPTGMYNSKMETNSVKAKNINLLNSLDSIMQVIH